MAARRLEATSHQFMSAADAERKGKAGEDLIREIFGKDAIAKDSALPLRGRRSGWGGPPGLPSSS
jgi:hypothetical protein